ncbi:MAG: GDSL family lipase [Pseudooceanicola sp.]|jgi:lysophospholipase L1-like esterase|nr:GDSL family lipase [Pseudooceanicola sp.]|tara:strand:- start:252 stop:926 length:675 start_codon:yes stop_codon:yes gene_type:complete
MRLLVSLLSLWLLAGCSGAPGTEPRILAIGDSVLAFHKPLGGSVPDVVASRLGQQVENRAVSGARISNSLSPDPARQYDIRQQYRPGTWDWVIFNGGANDLLWECGCNRCDVTLDGMISGDGRRGDIPALLGPIAKAGTRIAVLGYYDGNALPNAFSGCEVSIDRLNARLANMVAKGSNMIYVDAGVAMDPADPGLWFVDRVHPSRRGARAIGEVLAQAMARAP